MTKRTTINIDKEIRESLNACKKYKRETYDEVLKGLVEDRIRQRKAQTKGGLNKK